MRRKKGESFLSPLRFFYVSRAKFGVRHLPSPTPFLSLPHTFLFCMCIYYTPYLVLLSRGKNYILCFWRFEQKRTVLFSLLPKERKKGCFFAAQRGINIRLEQGGGRGNFERIALYDKRFIKSSQLA